MDLEKLSSLVSRLFFAAAFVFLVLAILERVLNAAGYTFLRAVYTPGRLVEFSGILLIFVVALLLRQVREELRKKR